MLLIYLSQGAHKAPALKTTTTWVTIIVTILLRWITTPRVYFIKCNFTSSNFYGSKVIMILQEFLETTFKKFIIINVCFTITCDCKSQKKKKKSCLHIKFKNIFVKFISNIILNSFHLISNF